jgi:hypothetical protein
LNKKKRKNSLKLWDVGFADTLPWPRHEIVKADISSNEIATIESAKGNFKAIQYSAKDKEVAYVSVNSHASEDER